MIADSERREVARRLRELDYADLRESLICAYLDALGIEGYADWVGIARRLADLIEPGCDRDALLALADEMDGIGDEIGRTIHRMMVFVDSWESCARRIRKASGVGR